MSSSTASWASTGRSRTGLKFYEDLIVRRGSVHSTAKAAANPVGVNAQQLSEAELNAAPHRVNTGGDWQATGAWTFDFLRRHGLQPSDYVLDVGCGSLNAAVHLLPFLDEGHYWGLDREPGLVDAGINLELPRAGVVADRGHYLINEHFQLNAIPHDLDVAIAGSLFAYLPYNNVAQCIAGVVRRLKPSGRFYATWFENPDPTDFDPIVYPGGGVTYPDRQPFHYSFEMIERVCTLVGATVERVADASHPRGEAVLAISKRSV